LSSALHRLAWLVFVLSACLAAEAQGTMKAEPAAMPELPSSMSSGSALPESASVERAVLPGSANIEDVPRVPGVSTLLRGLNAGITFSQVHDSSIGWYNVVTPAVSFNFSPHYSADASLSIYPFRLMPINDPTAPSGQQLVAARGDLGDTLIGLHARFNSRVWWNTTTASLTAPTGSRSDGLGAGKVTFDFSDQLERSIRQAGLLVDIGAGNSSGLFNSLVTNDYNSLGPLAHFQAGAVLWPFGRNWIQSVAYEQLPIGGQTVYTPIGPEGVPVPSGSGLSEDNGFTTSVGIPLPDHLAFLGYYNRSLHHRIDTVSFGMTYVWHGTRVNNRLAMIDRALREAEAGSR
jgi:hypothetical protein